MSIGDLMFVSYILFAAAVVFLAAAVVMFFKFDIRRIYKILKSAANPQSAAVKAPTEKELVAKTAALKTEASKTAAAKTEAVKTAALKMAALKMAAAETVALPVDIGKSEATKALDFCMETVPLPENQMPEQDFTQKYEQTLPLETIKFMLIQDITYTHDSANRLA